MESGVFADEGLQDVFDTLIDGLEMPDRIDLDQEWLDKYELEPYVFYKAIRLGYKVKEVPVTKIYPPKALGYTKMKPITGWWSIMRPVFLLALGLRK